jgi:hypothetical protein
MAVRNGGVFKLTSSNAIIARSNIHGSCAFAVVRNYDRRQLWPTEDKHDIVPRCKETRASGTAARADPERCETTVLAQEFPHQKYHQDAARFGAKDPQRRIPRPSITPGYGIFCIRPGLLRMYSAPPEENIKKMEHSERYADINLPSESYEGVVLDVRRTSLFVAVQVYHPDERAPGWINVWTSMSLYNPPSGCRFAVWVPPGGYTDSPPNTFQRASYGPPSRASSAAAAAEDELPAKVPRTDIGESISAGGTPAIGER